MVRLPLASFGCIVGVKLSQAMYYLKSRAAAEEAIVALGGLAEDHLRLIEEEREATARQRRQEDEQELEREHAAAAAAAAASAARSEDGEPDDGDDYDEGGAWQMQGPGAVEF